MQLSCIYIYILINEFYTISFNNKKNYKLWEFYSSKLTVNIHHNRNMSIFIVRFGLMVLKALELLSDLRPRIRIDRWRLFKLVMLPKLTSWFPDSWVLSSVGTGEFWHRSIKGKGHGSVQCFPTAHGPVRADGWSAPGTPTNTFCIWAICRPWASTGCVLLSQQATLVIIKEPKVSAWVHW